MLPQVHRRAASLVIASLFRALRTNLRVSPLTVAASSASVRQDFGAPGFPTYSPSTERPTEITHTFAYMPFSGDRRKCICAGVCRDCSTFLVAVSASAPLAAIPATHPAGSVAFAEPRCAEQRATHQPHTEQGSTRQRRRQMVHQLPPRPRYPGRLCGKKTLSAEPVARIKNQLCSRAQATNLHCSRRWWRWRCSCGATTSRWILRRWRWA